jgi:hypothetical protein
VNNDPRLVLNHNSPADRDRIWQLDSVVVSDVTEEAAIEDAEGRAHELWPDTHPPNTEAVHRKRPEARPGPIPAVRRQIFANETEKGQAC